MQPLNRPTEKQIAYICSLIGSTLESHAYGEIAKDMHCSTTAAQRRSTRADASATIDRLKAEHGQHAEPAPQRPPREIADE